MNSSSSSEVARRGFVLSIPAVVTLSGSGCLGAKDEETDISESSIRVSNSQQTEYEVEVLVRNVRDNEVLVDERTTVPPDESLRFDFTSKPDEDGTYPDIFAMVSMVDGQENTDQATRSFPPSAGASFSATIRDGGEIRLRVDQV